MLANQSTEPEYSIIVAMTAKGLIGNAGRLPWDLPEDLRLFKRLTLGGTLVMGRRTFVAIGHPLAERNNIVISTTQPDQPGIDVVPDFATALHRARELARPVFFIGGTEVYRQALDVADHLHISWVGGSYNGDTRFPKYNRNDWVSCCEELHPGFRYTHYRRKVTLSPES